MKVIDRNGDDEAIISGTSRAGNIIPKLFSRSFPVWAKKW